MYSRIRQAAELMALGYNGSWGEYILRQVSSKQLPRASMINIIGFINQHSFAGMFHVSAQILMNILARIDLKRQRRIQLRRLVS
jgi:hypothetical protein